MTDEEKQRKERMKEYRRRYREKHGIQGHHQRWTKVIGAAAIIGILGFGSFFIAQSKAAAMVTLAGKPAADWSEAEIQSYLEGHEKELQQKRIDLKAEDVQETLNLRKVEVAFDRDRIEDELYLIGRQGSPIQRVADVVTTLRFGKDVPLSIKVNDDKLDSFISDMYDAYNTDPENAYAAPNADNKTVTVHKEKARIVIDKDGLKNSIEEDLHQGVTTDIAVPVANREEASVKAGDLKSIDTVLSYYTTHFDDTNQNRNDNIRLAQKKLNHALVQAQKDFSFNDYVGTRTSDKGYKDAPEYFDNKLVPAPGGGVCQVSTTLFNAVLRAGLFIASRAPHFAPAAYVPVGMDASVADGSLDFSFTNPFQHPVYVYTVAEANSVTTYILGNHADTCTTEFKTTDLKNLPHTIIHKHDDQVTTDKREQEGYDGHDVTIKRTVSYTDGDHYSDTIVSHYAPNDEIILTNGPASEETVSTADLQPQDILINAVHDMMQAVAPPPEDSDSGSDDTEDES
ncbi:MAG: VanW family protein [Megasphaera sp.]|nr:VanW family protein [Megasphaera sp.]